MLEDGGPDIGPGMKDIGPGMEDIGPGWPVEHCRDGHVYNTTLVSSSIVIDVRKINKLMTIHVHSKFLKKGIMKNDLD